MEKRKKQCINCIFYKQIESGSMVNPIFIFCDKKVPFKFMNAKKCKHFNNK